jgi:hypothetical protein
MSIFSGDPKFFVSEYGSTFRFVSGQPVMEQGAANAALMALFTKPGWCGNVLAKSDTEKIGSDFEEAVFGPITLLSLKNIRFVAEDALVTAGFKVLSIEVLNPVSNRISVKAVIQHESGTVYSLFLSNRKTDSPPSFVDEYALLDMAGDPILDMAGNVIYVNF